MLFFNQQCKIRYSVHGAHILNNSCYYSILYYIIIFSAVKRLITINHIQNKSFYLHNICVCSVYIYYVYINTHMHVYTVFQKKNIFIY